MKFVTRRPDLSDTSGLCRLIQEHAAFEKSAAPLTEIDLASLLQHQDAVCFLVAAEGRTLLGYAAITFDWSVWRARRYAHLECLFVSELNRGRGIGGCLFAEARGVAKQEGVDRMEWQTPAWNEQAIGFYRREGAYCQEKARFAMMID